MTYIPVSALQYFTDGTTLFTVDGNNFTFDATTRVLTISGTRTINAWVFE